MVYFFYADACLYNTNVFSLIWNPFSSTDIYCLYRDMRSILQNHVFNMIVVPLYIIIWIFKDGFHSLILMLIIYNIIELYFFRTIFLKKMCLSDIINKVFIYTCLLYGEVGEMVPYVVILIIYKQFCLDW